MPKKNKTIRHAGPLLMVHVLDVDAPNGATRLARGLEKGWVERGYAVRTVWIAGPARQTDAAEVVLGEAYPKTLWAWGKLALRLCGLMRGWAPAAVLTFGPYADALAMPVATCAGVPVRLSTALVAPRQMPKGAWRALRLWMRLGWVPWVLVPSVKMQTLLARVSLRVRKVPFGIGFAPSSLSLQAARASLDLPLQGAVVVSVGRLEEISHPDVLLRALVNLPDVVWVVVGEGTLEADLRAQAMRLGVAGRFLIRAPLPAERMPDLLAAADLLVDAAAWDSPSSIPVEAAMGGLPLVLSDTGAHRELAQLGEDDYGAVFFNPNNPSALAEAVRGILADPQALAAARRMSARLAKRYDFGDMMEAYEGVVKEAFGERG